MKNIAEFYKNWLGFDSYYDIVINNINSSKEEFIQSANILNGYTRKPIQPPTGIECQIGDIRIDVPIWFGNLSTAKRRIIVFGLEPRDTNSQFNLERVGSKVFASPFGLDRWNEHSTVTRRPQNRYYRVFKDLISDESNFVLFSDIVKDYKVVSGNNLNRANDLEARNNFLKKAEEGLLFLEKEIGNVSPTHILTLGNESFNFLRKHYSKSTHRLRHPSNGGEKQAKEQLKALLQAV
jgi:hypothetical protein